jgi:hypothetical protein
MIPYIKQIAFRLLKVKQHFVPPEIYAFHMEQFSTLTFNEKKVNIFHRQGDVINFAITDLNPITEHDLHCHSQKRMEYIRK